MNIPIYQKIRKYASEQLYKFPNSEVKIPSELELCKKFKVTRPTVRKALKELICENYLLVKPGIGTYTNPKRTLNGENSSRNIIVIGVITQLGKEVYWHGYSCRMISGITSAISNSGACCRIINLNKKLADAHEEIAEYDFDGLIWLNPNPEGINAIMALKRTGLPIITSNVTEANINNVGYDSVMEGFLAGEYFIKNDYKNVLFISDCVDRLTGFKKAFTTNNLKYNEKLILNPDHNLEDNLRKRIQFGVEFSGIFVHGYYIHDVLNAFKAEGLDITKDCNVLGHEFAMCGYPEFDGLDRIRLPLEKVGKLAVESILDLIKNNIDEKALIKLQPKIIIV